MRSNARIEYRQRRDRRTYGIVVSFQVGFWPPEGDKKKWITITGIPGAPFHLDDKQGIRAAEEFLDNMVMPRLRKKVWAEGYRGLMESLYGKKRTIGDVHDEMVEEYNASHAQDLMLQGIASDKPIWNIEVDQLTSGDCEQFLKSFPSDRSRAAIKAYRHRLGAVLKYARRMRYMTADPLRDVSITWGANLGKHKENYLTETERDQLLATPAPSPWAFNLFCFMFCTSCGPADLMKFKYSDVVEIDGELVIDTGRKKNNRPLLIFFDDIKRFLPARKDDDDFMWGAQLTGGLLHIKEHRKHVQKHITEPLNKQLKKWCLDAGLSRNGKPHTIMTRAMRRGFFTAIYERNGHDIVQTGRAGGHATSRHTVLYIKDDVRKQLDNARLAHLALSTSMQKKGLQSHRI